MPYKEKIDKTTCYCWVCQNEIKEKEKYWQIGSLKICHNCYYWLKDGDGEYNYRI